MGRRLVAGPRQAPHQSSQLSTLALGDWHVAVTRSVLGQGDWLERLDVGRATHLVNSVRRLGELVAPEAHGSVACYAQVACVSVHPRPE
eukprot:4604423-Pyramimonas_sp.AAC.1